MVRRRVYDDSIPIKNGTEGLVLLHRYCLAGNELSLLPICGVLDLLCLQVDLKWILFKFDLVVTVSRIFHSGKITESAESRGNSTLSQPKLCKLFVAKATSATMAAGVASSCRPPRCCSLRDRRRWRHSIAGRSKGGPPVGHWLPPPRPWRPHRRR
jgi:hypothetical protein